MSIICKLKERFNAKIEVQFLIFKAPFATCYKNTSKNLIM